LWKLPVVAVFGLSLMLLSVPASAQPSGEDFDVGAPMGDSVPHGPGTSIDLCRFITQAEAEQLVGVALQPAQWSGPGWVNSCGFGALGSSSIAHAALNVSDYGTHDQAVEIFDQNALMAVVGGNPLLYHEFGQGSLYDASFVRYNSLAHSMFVLKGQYMIEVDAFAPRFEMPTDETMTTMATIASRVLPAL